MTILKLTSFGNSVGAIFPKEMLARLRVDKGDNLYVTEASDCFIIRNYDEDFVSDMKMAEKIIHENRNVLKKLAE